MRAGRAEHSADAHEGPAGNADGAEAVASAGVAPPDDAADGVPPAGAPPRVRAPASPIFSTALDRAVLAGAAPPPTPRAPHRRRGVRNRSTKVNPAVPTSHRTAEHCGLPALDGGAVELFAGLGLTLHAYAHHGFAPVAAAEQQASKQRALRASFDGIVIVHDALEFDIDALKQQAPCAIVAVFGGVPCQPVAPNGKQLGLALVAWFFPSSVVRHPFHSHTCNKPNRRRYRRY